jgi:ubiquinol-cytochrome c reductase cytochrome b subunit
MFFLAVYIHIFRSLFYGSYKSPREVIWIIGLMIYLLMMAAAFMGYVLPWGQMSFWGATVITNLFSAIPLVGRAVVEWLWGGFSVDNATLNRFFSLHFVVPFIIAGVVLIHLALLHQHGSNNPLGVDTSVDKVPFYPYYFVKDLHAFCWLMTLFTILVYFYPNYLGHPDNYIPANPLVTPAHIVPEWYFLPFYAILRSIPSKLGGVSAMLGALLILFIIPYTNTSEVRSTQFRPIFRICFWFLISDFLLLGWAGQKPVATPYLELGQILTAYYFLFFGALIPIVGKVEKGLIEAHVERIKKDPNYKI